MKISLVIADGYKQVMMTPESDHEREAMRHIEPSDTLQVVQKQGAFDDKPTHYSYNVSLAQGGYLRRFAETDSIMFVISKKSPPTNPDTSA